MYNFQVQLIIKYYKANSFNNWKIALDIIQIKLSLYKKICIKQVVYKLSNKERLQIYRGKLIFVINDTLKL